MFGTTLGPVAVGMQDAQQFAAHLPAGAFDGLLVLEGPRAMNLAPGAAPLGIVQLLPPAAPMLVVVMLLAAVTACKVVAADVEPAQAAYAVVAAAAKIVAVAVVVVVWEVLVVAAAECDGIVENAVGTVAAPVVAASAVDIAVGMADEAAARVAAAAVAEGLGIAPLTYVARGVTVQLAASASAFEVASSSFAGTASPTELAVPCPDVAAPTRHGHGVESADQACVAED